MYLEDVLKAMREGKAIQLKDDVYQYQIMTDKYRGTIIVDQHGNSADLDSWRILSDQWIIVTD